MGVDLKSVTTFSRISMVLLDDCVVKLEHQSTQDRVRRFAYDRIEGVVIWTRPSWLRIAICAICLLVPGILLGLLTDATSIFGWVLAGIGALLVCWYFYCRTGTIRIIRGGQNYDLKGLYRPGKLRRFRDNLLARIQAAQIAQNVEAASPPAEHLADISAAATAVPPALPNDVAEVPTTN